MSPTEAAVRDEPSPRTDEHIPAFAFVVNGGSGHQPLQERLATIEQQMRRDGRPFHVERLERGSTLQATVARAADWAAARGAALVAAGGDGTQNAVAQAAWQARLPLGTIPQGTFNYFGREHDVATETDAAMDALLRATPRPVQAGMVNGRLFLVNASLGLYPQLLQDREAFKRRHGRYRINAALAATGTILREHRFWTLELTFGDEKVVVQTATLFVGNNALQLGQVGVSSAQAIQRGALAAVLVRPIGRLPMLGLALRGALGRLGEASHVLDFAFHRLVVRPATGSARRRIRLAVDGELCRIDSPLTFELAAPALRLLLPG